MCCLFVGKKFCKKFTPNPALYPSSKNTDSGGGTPDSSPLVILLNLVSIEVRLMVTGEGEKREIRNKQKTSE